MMRTERFRAITFVCAVFSILAASAPAQSSDLVKGPIPVHKNHQYSAYEQMIFKNASQFHMNFNNREFAKNGDLVVTNLHTNSNGTELMGRDAFVQRIARFVGPFPDVKIHDMTIVVDGNTAVVRFVITGTQKGDLDLGGGNVIKATNKPIHLDGAEIFTFDEKGELTDLVTIENNAQLLAQLK